jgi:HD superfamily phosphodiesterase
MADARRTIADGGWRKPLRLRLFRSTALASGLLLLVLASLSTAANVTVPGQASSARADWHKKVLQFAQEHFRHPAWGFSHSVRDYELARELAREDKVNLDEDVLYAAAYLHDMAAFAPWDREKEGIDHADEGARIVDTVLAGTGFPMNKIEAVRSAIKTHMFDRDPVGPEATYLHDADALDWLGAVGIARIFALVDPNGGDPDGPKAVKMLDDNLSAVPQRVQSPAGQRLAKIRAAELRQFLDELRRETDALRTL